MAGSENNMPPAKDPFPGSLTPGWNDPPQLTHSETTDSNSRPRLNHKKGTLFPMEGLNDNGSSVSGSSSSTNDSSNVVNSGATSTTSVRTTKPIAKVPPQCASVPLQQSVTNNSLPPLPPLPPKADASSWPVATVHPHPK